MNNRVFYLFAENDLHFDDEMLVLDFKENFFTTRIVHESNDVGRTCKINGTILLIENNKIRFRRDREEKEEEEEYAFKHTFTDGRHCFAFDRPIRPLKTQVFFTRRKENDEEEE